MHWTAVVTKVEGEGRCGLASTLQQDHHHHTEPDVPRAGQLELQSSSELASLIWSANFILVGVGVAATNALLPKLSHGWVELNAEEVIATSGARKNVALVGHFPFVPRLQSQVGKLSVLEQHLRSGNLSAATAAEYTAPLEMRATNKARYNSILEVQDDA